MARSQQAIAVQALAFAPRGALSPGLTPGFTVQTLSRRGCPARTPTGTPQVRRPPATGGACQ
jgi:hypothetical protein